jgi:hypothetical protein
MIRASAASLAVVIGFAIAVPPAYAVKEFYAQLEAKYVNRDSRDENDVAVANAFQEARCTICHPADDKHKLSRYAAQLSMRVGAHDKKNKKRIQDALEEVGALRSDHRDPKSPTYHELFRQGKFPPPSGY